MSGGKYSISALLKSGVCLHSQADNVHLIRSVARSEQHVNIKKHLYSKPHLQDLQRRARRAAAAPSQRLFFSPFGPWTSRINHSLQPEPFFITESSLCFGRCSQRVILPSNYSTKKATRRRIRMFFCVMFCSLSSQSFLQDPWWELQTEKWTPPSDNTDRKKQRSKQKRKLWVFELF